MLNDFDVGFLCIPGAGSHTSTQPSEHASRGAACWVLTSQYRPRNQYIEANDTVLVAFRQFIGLSFLNSLDAIRSSEMPYDVLSLMGLPGFKEYVECNLLILL